MAEVAHQTGAIINSNIEKIDTLIGSGIFSQQNSRSPFLFSSFLEIIILLSDHLQWIKKQGTRVDFTEDVPSDIGDVTDLVSHFRNTFAHPQSKKYYFNQGVFLGFSVAYGICNFAKIGEVELTSDYPDDTCIFAGPRKIYLKRHIKRAHDAFMGQWCHIDPWKIVGN